MKKEINKILITSIITCISFITVGILLLFYPNEVLSIISYSLGGIIGVIGLISIIRYFNKNEFSKFSKYGIVYGIVCLVLCSLFIFKQKEITKIFPFVIGMFILISSGIKLQYTVELKKLNNDNYKVTLIVSIFNLIFGLLLIFNPFKKALLMTQVVGVFIIFYAILDLIETCIIKFNIKETDGNLIEVKNKKEV